MGLQSVAGCPLFTVFIPTYNRAHTLSRALESVASQTFSDFEILVVDDGSIDDTRSLVREWQKSFRSRLRYIYQENQGKHVAYNAAAREARGKLLALLDSDDVMLPHALQILADAWFSIPADVRIDFAGVEGLCQDSRGRLHGDRFPEDRIDSDYLEMTRHYGVRGEKRHAIRVDVLQQFPYPVIVNERHIRPDFTWKRIAHRYRFRYINQVLQVVDFQSDGLTRNATTRRLRNPAGLYIYWLDDVVLHPDHQSAAERRYAVAQLIRYGLLSGHGIREQWSKVPDRLLWARMLPRGIGDHCVDLIKRWRLRHEGKLV